MSKNWQSYFLDIATVVRQKSKDPNTKVGAVIVGPENQILSTGFNGFPRKVNEEISVRWERPLKYKYVEHAERNAIYNAARHGITLRGSTMYLVGFSIPCTDCTRAIIQCGITAVFGLELYPPSSHWEDNLCTALIMLDEAGIDFIEVE